MIGYIYLIIDLTNLKKYVGQHHYHLKKLDSNYHGSGTIISKIYKKRPHTLKEVYLKTCYTQEELDEWEQYYINFYNTLSPNGYNLQEGGRGGLPSEETRMRMSQAHKGLCVGEKHPNYGKKASDETRRKLSESHKGLCAGEKHPMFGKHHSLESRKKISKTVLQYTLDNKLVREWISAHEAARVLNIDRGNITKCCRGNTRLKTYKGFKWKYKKEVV